MGAVLLGIVFIIGYSYQNSHPISRIALKRSESYHIYFKAGLQGLTLLFFTSLFWLCLDYYNYPSKLFEACFSGEAFMFLLRKEYWDELKVISVFTIMLTLSFIWCKLVCCFYWLFDNRKIKKIFSIVNDLERLIINQTIEVSPVRLELDSGKVYVGIPEMPSFDSGHLKYITVVPLLSGSVDANKKLTFNYNYYNHYQKLIASDFQQEKIEDFKVILPVEEIVTASKFSVDAYVEFTKDNSSELVV